MTNGTIKRMTAAAAALALAVGAWAEGFADFKLRGVVPGDAFLAVHTRGHDGKAFLNEQMTRVWAAVESARFDRDLKRLFKDMAADGGMTDEEVEALWEKVMGLCQRVDWANLATEEYAMGMRMAQMGPVMMPEWVVVMQPPSAAVETNFSGLSGMLEELAKVAEKELLYSSEELEGNAVNRLTFANAPFPITLAVARADDRILLSFGSTMLEQTLILLAGGEGDALAGGERFQAAFKHLPPPVDSATYFDTAKLVGQLGAYAGQMIQMVPEETPDYEKIRALPEKIFAEIDFVDYVAGVGATEGKKSTMEAIARFKDNAPETGLYKIFYSNDPLTNPLKYVPADAGNVSVNSGMRPLLAVDTILDFVRAHVPDGEQIDAHLAEAKTEIGFDIREDVLGWINGQVISYQIPGPNAYTPGDWLMMVGVNDAGKGQAFLAQLVEMATPMVGQNAKIEPAQVHGHEGFYTIKAPMLQLAQLSNPTIGVHDKWLFVGSTPDIIGRSLDVAAGELADFSTNERFKTEGLPLSGEVLSYSFTDLSNWGQQMGQAFGMIGLVSMGLGEAAREQPLQTLLTMAPKLGRVFRAVDFLQSSSSVSTMEGQLVRTRSVTNFREPPKVEKPEPPTGDDGATGG